MSLKVCLFVDNYPTVSETFITRQVASLRAQGHHVTVIAGAPGHGAERPDEPDDRLLYIGEGVATWARKMLGAAALFLHRMHRERQPGQRRLRDIFAPIAHHGPIGLRDAMVLARRTPRLRFDVVLAHFGPVGVRAGRLIEAGLLGGSLAVVFHGYDVSRQDVLRDFGPAYRHLFAIADQLLPISALWRERLIAMGARPAQVEVLHMGVEVPAPGTETYRPIARDRPLRVLTVARLTEKKGVAYALEGLIASGMTVRYAVIGDGPLKPTLEVLARQAGPNCEVEFLGARDHGFVLDELRNTDVFLLPSVTSADGDMEGIPVSLMEAMAAGVLVVATRHSGIPELVVDGETGFLVPERDPVAIAELFRHIAGSGGSFEALREGAMRKVREEFNTAVVDLALEAVCRRMAAREMLV